MSKMKENKCISTNFLVLVMFIKLEIWYFSKLKKSMVKLLAKVNEIHMCIFINVLPPSFIQETYLYTKYSTDNS